MTRPIDGTNRIGTGIQMSFTNEEIEEFKIEAEELLENAELSLLSIDRGGDFRSQYDAIFRAFHSIKGAAGMMDMTHLQEHMHRLETTLTEQKSMPTLQKPYIELFLRGIDGCRQLLRNQTIHFDYSVAVAVGAASKSVEQSVSLVRETAAAIAKPKTLGRILVVDDEIELVELFVDAFSRSGYDVRGCTSPLEALELAKSFLPDAMVSDISMPEMTGLELMKLVKSVQPDLPVLVVSGFMDKHNLMEAIGLGVFTVIEKPFEMNRVLAQCANAVKQHQMLKLIGSSLNLLMYQFSDLDQFLRDQGKDDVRKLIRTQMDELIEQRRAWRVVARAGGKKAA